MGRFVNPDNSAFQVALNSKIYMDKTGLLEYTNSVLDTPEAYICNSRPRRFGKSYTANMLAAYYSKGCDSEKMFDGLTIGKSSDFKKHLNKYDVIHIDVQWFLSSCADIKSIISYITKSVLEELKEYYPEVLPNEVLTLADALSRIRNSTGQKFIVIIDEWDILIRDEATNKAVQEEYIYFLRGLFKGTEPTKYIQLAYLTGILPIKKEKTQSALNNFDEFTMVSAGTLAPFIGFTEEEVRQLCERYHMSFEQTKQWYDGYNINGISIYNPKSVAEAMSEQIFDSYWTQTETYEALKMYIVRNENGLRDKIIRMIAGEHISINTKTFQNDMCTFETADDILTLLVHLGYLTYDFDTKTAWIPNKEVRQEFLNSIQGQEFQTVNNAIHRSDKLLQLTLAQNTEKVAEMLQEVHCDNCSVIQYNDENSLACVLSLAYYSAQDSYAIYRELQGGEGFADLVFIPRTGNHNPAMIVELKWNQSTGIALEQIKDRNYIRCLKDYHGKVLFVGVNYDKKSKKHTCQFEIVEL